MPAAKNTVLEKTPENTGALVTPPRRIHVPVAFYDHGSIEMFFDRLLGGGRSNSSSTKSSGSSRSAPILGVVLVVLLAAKFLPMLFDASTEKVAFKVLHGESEDQAVGRILLTDPKTEKGVKLGKKDILALIKVGEGMQQESLGGATGTNQNHRPVAATSEEPDEKEVDKFMKANPTNGSGQPLTREAAASIVKLRSTMVPPGQAK